MKMTLFGGKFKQLAKKLWGYNKKQVPRGYFPVDVIGEAPTAESNAVRYFVSIEFLNCQCFKTLLDEYEDEIRMYTRGPITLPCSVHKFEEALYRDRLHSRIDNRYPRHKKEEQESTTSRNMYSLSFFV